MDKNSVDTFQLPKPPERGKVNWTDRLQRGTARIATIGALAGVITAGCTPNSDNEPIKSPAGITLAAEDPALEQPPVVEVDAADTPTETTDDNTTETAAPGTETESGLENVTREDAEAIRALPVEDFYALPREKRLAAGHIYLEIAKRMLSAYTYSVEGPDGQTIYDEVLYYSNPLDKASIDNTGQEILDQFRFARQLIAAQRNNEDADGSSLDSQIMNYEAAEKAASVGYYRDNYNDDVWQASRESLLKNVFNSGHSFAIGEYMTAVKVSELQEGVDRNGNKIVYRDIEYKQGVFGSEDERPSSFTRFVYTTYLLEGVEYGFWQAYEEASPNFEPDPNDPANQ